MFAGSKRPGGFEVGVAGYLVHWLSLDQFSVVVCWLPGWLAA